MRVCLVSHTMNPEHVLAKAAAECYNKTPSINRVKKIIKAGHFSVLEHVSFTFHVEGLSRACSHQLVRHRIASYTQQSQRYVNEENFEYITPPSIEEKGVEAIYYQAMEACNVFYKELIKHGVPKEDARYVLPNACTTSLAFTMNLRTLLNFCILRMDKAAQWEIRELAKWMLYHALQCLPNLADELRAIVERGS